MNEPKEALRRRAERLLFKGIKTIPEIPAGDMRKLIQELQVHQVELEIQNEELRKAQVAIEESRSKYVDLYEFAPVGYLTLTPTGRIAEVNLTGAGLLGIERSRLVGRTFSVFLAPDSRPVFRLHCSEVLRTGTRESCEVKLNKKDGTFFHARLESTGVDGNEKNSTWIRSAVIDITKGKEAEEEIQKLSQELEQRVIERTAQLEEVNQKLEKEIMERKLVEEAVIKSLEQVEQIKLEWEATVDSLLQLIFLLDEQGRIFRANRTAEAWNLGSVGSVQGMKMHTLFHPGCTDQGCYLETLWPDARDKLLLSQSVEREFEDSILGRYLNIQIRPILARKTSLRIKADSFAVAIIWDITRRKRIEGERERLIHELQEALANIKRLRGLLPICASCKKIRDDKGYWNDLEAYILEHSEAEFSHGFCPDCMKKLYGVLLEDDTDSKKQ